MSNAKQKEKLNVFGIGNTIRAAVCIAALCGVQIADAVTIGGVTFIGNDLTSAADLGRMWMASDISAPKTYFDYSVKPTFTAAADGVLMRGSGSLATAAGKGFVIDVATGVTGAEIAAGALRFMGGPLGMGLIVGMPLLLDYLAKNDLRPFGKDLQHKEQKECTSDCWLYYQSEADMNANQNAIDPDSLANQRMAGQVAQGAPFIKTAGACNHRKDISQGTWLCPYTNSVNGDSNTVTNYAVSFWAKSVPSKSEEWKVIPLASAKPYLINPPNPNIIPEIVNKGGDFQPQPSVISGPSTVAGPKTTTTSSDGKTGTSQDVTNIKYEGNKVTTTTTNVTNSTVTNNDNSQTTTTTTTVKEDAPDTPDLCKEHPEILACSKPDLDTPSGEIPKSQKQITMNPENVFGEGGCPADATYTLHGGQSLKVWDWQYTCGKAVQLRALVIGLATFAAFLIVMPGSTRT